MKKLFISALCLFAIAFGANAQTRFGVKAGLNLANQSYSGSATNSGGTSTSTSSVTGFHIGGFAEIGIASGFYFQPGLYLSTKGSKVKVSFLGSSAEGTITPTYLEIPLNFGYAIGLGEKAKLHFLAGPYVAFGIGGKTKDPNGKTENIKWGSEKATLTNNGGSDLKSMDFGLNIGANIEYSNFLFGLQYGLGLSNVSPQEDTSIKNNVFGISVGYVFGGKSE